jgi:hypothetical protein
MPQKVAIKKLAHAMIMGLKLTYRRGPLRRLMRERLYDLLDDMCFGLTKEGIEERNVYAKEFAGILGALADEIGLPLKREQWPDHKDKKDD